MPAVFLVVGCVKPVTAVSRWPGPHAKPSLVAVLPFQGEYSLGVQHDPEGGARAAVGCHRALAEAGISVVPRPLVEAEIAEGRVRPRDDASAIAMAKRLGADFVIVGATISGKLEMVVNVSAIRSDGTVDARARSNEIDGDGDAMYGLGHHVCSALFR